ERLGCSVFPAGKGYRDDKARRSYPYRIRSGGFPPPGETFARAHRCPEYRPHESRGLLPQLPLELDEGRRRREGRRAQQGRKPGGGLWHALRRMEKALSARGEREAKSSLREIGSKTLKTKHETLSPDKNSHPDQNG